MPALFELCPVQVVGAMHQAPTAQTHRVRRETKRRCLRVRFHQVASKPCRHRPSTPSKTNDAVLDMAHDGLNQHSVIQDELKSEPSLSLSLLRLLAAAKARQGVQPTSFYPPRVDQQAINDAHPPQQFQARAAPQVAPARRPYLRRLHARHLNSLSYRDFDCRDAD